MKLTLSYTPVACSLVPFILLTEAGADFDLLPVNMGKKEQYSPEYLRINPKAKVPALIIDGQVLTENVAIQLWIARQYPQARLLPENLSDEVRAVSVMAWCASGIHPKLTQQARPERYCSLDGTADNVRELGAQSLLELLDIAEDMLTDREWFFDHFTCADAYFYWCFRRGSDFVDTSRFRNCTAHRQRMESRPSVQKLLACEKRVQADFSA